MHLIVRSLVRRTLRRGPWELDIAPETVPTAHGSSIPHRWFENQHPSGGLVDPVYALLRESPEAPIAAVNALVETYFVTTDATELLAELGLSDPGPGAICGVTVLARGTLASVRGRGNGSGAGP
jgi:hypothetical protein